MHRLNKFSTLVFGGLAALLPATVGAMEVGCDYHVPFTPENAIIGHFSATKKPVLTVKSGAIVRIDGGGGGGATRSAEGADPNKWLAENDIALTVETSPALQETIRVLKETPRAPGIPGGHLLVGPVFIEEAEPGDTLEVRILDVTPRLPYGTTGSSPGRGGLALGAPAATPSLVVAAAADATGKVSPSVSRTGDSPRPASKVTHLDLKRNAGIFDQNVEIPLGPFMGVMATCPPDSEGPNRSSTAPGAFGGNLDCKELVAGTTLYLPVFQKGALFYTGDSHAGQGDGEVTGTAIETADVCTLQFVLHKGKKLNMPRAETPADYITFGLDPDLNLAMRQAVAETVEFLKEKQGYDILQAYSLSSIAVNFHVTQVVDKTLGIHGMISKKIFINDPDRYWYRPH